MSSESPKFDIHSFDAAQLPLDVLISAAELLNHHTSLSGFTQDEWEHSAARLGRGAVRWKSTPLGSKVLPTLVLKTYTSGDLSQAAREFHAMQALYDMGISLAPRPFYWGQLPLTKTVILIAEWLNGTPLDSPPPTDDELMWHRIMSIIGVTKDVSFAKYATQIPMRGTVPHSPGDMFTHLDQALVRLAEKHPDHALHAELQSLIRSARARIQPNWNTPTKIGLVRHSPAPHHFIWDGHHLRAVGWDHCDWGDSAFALAEICAHPSYEELPSSHWVWFRWEYARLNHHDKDVVARATVYTELLWLYWAIQLQIEPEPLRVSRHQSDEFYAAQRQRYLARARKVFA